MTIPEKQQTASQPRTVKVLMFTVTESLADTLFGLSNILLIFGAAAVLIGTIGAIIMGGAREQFANERISANEAETARAKADAAEANSRAAQTNLELRKFKAPRNLGQAAQARVAAATRKFSGTQFDAAIGPMADPEPEFTLNSIAEALKDAGWVQISWRATIPVQTLLRPGLPDVGLASVTNAIIEYPTPMLKGAADALADALKAEGIDAAALASNGRGSAATNTNSNAIHLMIGRKL